MKKSDLSAIVRPDLPTSRSKDSIVVRVSLIETSSWRQSSLSPAHLIRLL